MEKSKKKKNGRSEQPAQGRNVGDGKSNSNKRSGSDGNGKASGSNLVKEDMMRQLKCNIKEVDVKDMENGTNYASSLNNSEITSLPKQREGGNKDTDRCCIKDVEENGINDKDNGHCDIACGNGESGQDFSDGGGVIEGDVGSDYQNASLGLGGTSHLTEEIAHEKEKTSSDAAETLPAEGETLPAEGETLPAEGETLPAEGETLPDEGETLPAEGETLPDERETLPDEGETLPCERGTLPAEGETLPAEGGTLPAEGETLPAEGETLPDEEETLLAEREILPTEGVALPDEGKTLPDGETLPDEAETLPCERGTLPAEGETLPAEGETLPTEGETLPAEGETLPAEGETLPAEGETLPTEGETLPAEGETLPAEGETLPAEGETLPDERETLPDEGETLPAERETLPAEGETLPAEGETLPAEGETLPAEGETLPDGGETLPDEGETLPDEGETLPDEGETLPDEGETLPDEGEALPDEGETLPAEGETLPAEGETLPAEGETLPDEGETLLGEGETLTDEGETLPAEEETLPDERETLLGEGETLPDEGETLPAEGETLPAEGETLPAEGKTLPDDGETLPDEGETLPAEGGTLPAEGETLPAEGETLPAEGETLLAEGETLPTEGVALPDEGKTLPDEGETLPDEAETLPCERGTLPAEGETLPAEGETLPTEGKMLPAEGETLPAEGETLPDEGETLPDEGETLPAEGETLPAEGETLPAEGETLPAEGETLPAEGETLPDGGETLPDEGETLPDEGETLPDEGETLPDEGETLPDEGETLPDEGETLPAEGETLPAEGETLPAEGETLPDEGETLPDEGETLPDEGETLPDEGETSPAGEDTMHDKGDTLPLKEEILSAKEETLPVKEETSPVKEETFLGREETTSKLEEMCEEKATSCTQKKTLYCSRETAIKLVNTCDVGKSSHEQDEMLAMGKTALMTEDATFDKEEAHKREDMPVKGDSIKQIKIYHGQGNTACKEEETLHDVPETSYEEMEMISDKGDTACKSQHKLCDFFSLCLLALRYAILDILLFPFMSVWHYVSEVFKDVFVVKVFVLPWVSTWNSGHPTSREELISDEHLCYKSSAVKSSNEESQNCHALLVKQELPSASPVRHVTHVGTDLYDLKLNKKIPADSSKGNAKKCELLHTGYVRSEEENSSVKEKNFNSSMVHLTMEACSSNDASTSKSLEARKVSKSMSNIYDNSLLTGHKSIDLNQSEAMVTASKVDDLKVLPVSTYEVCSLSNNEVSTDAYITVTSLADNKDLIDADITVTSLADNKDLIDADITVTSLADNKDLIDADITVTSLADNKDLIDADITVTSLADNKVLIGADITVTSLADNKDLIDADIIVTSLADNKDLINADITVTSLADNKDLIDADITVTSLADNKDLIDADITLTSLADNKDLIDADITVTSLADNKDLIDADITVTSLADNKDLINADITVTSLADNKDLIDADITVTSLADNKDLIDADITASSLADNKDLIVADITVTSLANKDLIDTDITVTNLADNKDLIDTDITVTSLADNKDLIAADITVASLADNKDLIAADITVASLPDSTALNVSTKVFGAQDPVISAFSECKLRCTVGVDGFKFSDGVCSGDDVTCPLSSASKLPDTADIKMPVTADAKTFGAAQAETSVAVQAETSFAAQAEKSVAAQVATFGATQAETSVVVQAKTSVAAQAKTSDAVQAETSAAAQAKTSDAVQAETSDAVQAETSAAAQAKTSDAAQVETSDAVQAETSVAAQSPVKIRKATEINIPDVAVEIEVPRVVDTKAPESSVVTCASSVNINIPTSTATTGVSAQNRDDFDHHEPTSLLGTRTGRDMDGPKVFISEEVKGAAIGIDLGTSKCCVAVVRDGQVVVIENERACKTMPSYVAFNNTNRLVGEDAKDKVAFNSANTIFRVKKIIGKHWEEHSLQDELRQLSFTVFDADEGRPCISVEYRGETRELSPEQVTAMLIMKMKRVAERHLEEKVTHAVISVPCSFNQRQRQATVDAAVIAGVEVLSLISEPAAAALAYWDNRSGTPGGRSKREEVLVFDLGGGGLDVAVVAVSDICVQVRGSHGDASFGGDEFDAGIMKYLDAKVQEKFGSSVLKNKKQRERLRIHSEKAKRDLTLLPKANILIETFVGEDDFRATITRTEFLEIFSKSTEIKCSDAINKVLYEANVHSMKNINEVIIVGGSSRVPMVQNVLRELFGGKSLNQTVNADEAVAAGAALWAAQLSRDRHVKELVLLDVFADGALQGNTFSAGPLDLPHLEISNMKNEVEQFDEDDRKLEEAITAMNNLEKFCYKTEDIFKESEKHFKKIGKDTREAVLNLCQCTIEWLDDNDSKAKEEYTNKKSELTQRLLDILGSCIEIEILNKVEEKWYNDVYYCAQQHYKTSRSDSFSQNSVKMLDPEETVISSRSSECFSSSPAPELITENRRVTNQSNAISFALADSGAHTADETVMFPAFTDEFLDGKEPIVDHLLDNELGVRPSEFSDVNLDQKIKKEVKGLVDADGTTVGEAISESDLVPMPCSDSLLTSPKVSSFSRPMVLDTQQLVSQTQLSVISSSEVSATPSLHDAIPSEARAGSVTCEHIRTSVKEILENPLTRSSIYIGGTERNYGNTLSRVLSLQSAVPCLEPADKLELSSSREENFYDLYLRNTAACVGSGSPARRRRSGGLCSGVVPKRPLHGTWTREARTYCSEPPTQVNGTAPAPDSEIGNGLLRNTSRYLRTNIGEGNSTDETSVSGATLTGGDVNSEMKPPLVMNDSDCTHESSTDGNYSRLGDSSADTVATNWDGAASVASSVSETLPSMQIYYEGMNASYPEQESAKDEASGGPLKQLWNYFRMNYLPDFSERLRAKNK